MLWINSVILLVFVGFSCATNDDRSGTSYFNVAFGTESFNVQFGDGHLNVWEHTRTKGRYYVSPITGLLADSAICQNNSITENSVIELRFKLIMWSEEARRTVYEHIRNNVNGSVMIESIEPLPMERIRLVWRDTDRPLSGKYHLSRAWKVNTRLPSVADFLILCDDMSACEHLKGIMKETPHVLDALELQYVIEAQRSSRRTVNIQGKHVMKSRLFTQLKNQVNPSTAPVYLKSEDLKRIVSETVSAVVASVITDADYELENDFSIKEAITDVLAEQKVSTREWTPQLWNSTFWNPVMARPDKVTKELNSIYSKDSNDSRSLIVNEEALNSQSSGRGRMNAWIISADINIQRSNSRVKKARTEDVVNTLKERNANVEWNGERFVVKPIDLYRLNMMNLDTTSTLAIKNVQIKKHEYIHHIRVNVEPMQNQTPPFAVSAYSVKGMFQQQTDKIIRFTNDLIRTAPIEVGLVNGTDNATVHSGRVQIVYYGVTGTICDDNWSNYDAKVICRMLGYTGRAVPYSKGPIWLDEVNCNAHDQHIGLCEHEPWGFTDCSHAEDAGVLCYIN